MNKLDRLLDYLEKEWGNKVMNEFLNVLEENMQTIKFYPTIGNPTSISKIRSILITKHNRIYYRIEEDLIIVINMIDTRSNPKKNPFNKYK